MYLSVCLSDYLSVCLSIYITDHMRVHNQSQHHSCHLCNRSFTTLTYLRVHAQKHHGQEWKDSGGGFGTTGSGGVLVCQLCGVHCKTPTQLQGHMGTHNPPNHKKPRRNCEKRHSE
uniref:Si:ch211-166g5.4 n=1 Tax=Sinocyclocheilus grahami TaxID=75366 RepID=A0A672NUE9_SINGR